MSIWRKSVTSLPCFLFDFLCSLNANINSMRWIYGSVSHGALCDVALTSRTVSVRPGPLVTAVLGLPGNASYSQHACPYICIYNWFKAERQFSKTSKNIQVYCPWHTEAKLWQFCSFLRHPCPKAMRRPQSFEGTERELWWETHWLILMYIIWLSQQTEESELFLKIGEELCENRAEYLV